MKHLLLGSALLLAAIPAAHAVDAPRFIVTAGYAGINQDGDGLVPVSLGNSYPAGSEVEDSDDSGVGALGLSWYVTPNVAIELWGASSTENRIEIDVERGPDVQVAGYSTRPLVLGVQYHFADAFTGWGERVTPFVGVGYHRTSVSGVNANAALPGYAGLKIDDGNGIAFSAGVDVALSGHWFARGDVRYLRWDAESFTANGQLAKADMDSLIYGLNIGLRF